MPNWKKVIVSGSDAALNSLYAPSITGSLLGTASYAIYAETSSLSTRTTQTDLLALNQNGFTIPKGTVVRITGSNNASDIPRIVTASYENDGNSANTLGITTAAISNGATGYVITEGVLTGIDTSNFTSGTLLYLGATGSIIGTVPSAPLHAVRLGQVIREQSNNGSIHVRIDNGYEIGELHDVFDTTTSTSYGDLLIKSASVWTNSKQLSGSYSITGSLVVTGSLLITGSSTLINQGPTILSGSFKVQGEGDGFGGPITTAITVDDINFTRKLHDSQTGSGSLDFANRDLLDANGNGAFNWNGVAATIDSRLYINQTVSATVRNQLLTNVGVGGQLLNDVAFDSLVQTNDLVYLENDGAWYQVDQATDSSTRMLGICMGYDPMTYIGKVLLDGDVIVSTGPGYPSVAGAAYGAPVYIKEGVGTAMSTTVPVNDYVRLLGYCYHEAGGTEWIMKFRPSNEWIVL